MTIGRTFHPSSSRFRGTTLLVLLTFSVFCLLVPSRLTAAPQPQAAVPGECELIPKFEDFLSFEASREFLATIGETPESFLAMVEVLDTPRREHLWAVLAPVHPAAIAVEMYAANGYDRDTARLLVGELTHAELDAMIRYDQLEGGWHGGHGLWWGLGTAIVILAVVVLIALIVYLVYEEQRREERGGTRLDHLPEASIPAIGSHFRGLRSDLGLERTSKPTF